MKILIDENVNVAVCEPLRTIFANHTFVTTHEQGWSGLLDDHLFEAMQQAGFHALVTRDKKQLVNSEERMALRQCGLHWIGMSAPTQGGIQGLALETAAIVAGLPYVLEDMSDRRDPTAFHVKSIPSEHNQRVRVELL